ncbi:hypothetical protein MIDIC_240045 [Alphaproteobacteria bacterium]
MGAEVASIGTAAAASTAAVIAEGGAGVSVVAGVSTAAAWGIFALGAVLIVLIPAAVVVGVAIAEFGASCTAVGKEMPSHPSYYMENVHELSGFYYGHEVIDTYDAI